MEGDEEVETLPPVDEDEEQLLRNFGENKLMGRVQEALRIQLEEQLTRLSEDLRETEQAREASRIHREDVGVQLYGVQQQLASMQQGLDKKSESIRALAEKRAQDEGQAKALQDDFLLRGAALKQAETQVEAFRGELDGILDTTRQVEKYNEEMAGEVAENRRATLKATEATREKEKAKLAQDAYIDRMTAAVRRAGDELATYQAQIDAQKAEGGAALATMAEANTEMDTIRLEKKALLLQWQSTTLSLRRRDEALAAIASTLKDATVELGAMDAEEGNYRKAVHVAQGAHARLSDLLEREESDLRMAEEQGTTLRRQWEALEARRADVASTLEATDAESKRAAVETVRLLRIVKELEAARGVADRSRFGVEDDITKALASRITNEKAGKAMAKDADRLLQRTHALEIEKAEAENAMARARVEALTISSRLATLRDTLSALNRDVFEKEALVAKCEMDIRQRQDAIDKKASVLDRLNRKSDRLAKDSSNVGGEPSGPLQAAIKGLVDDLETIRSENEGAQRRWLTDQTALVASSTETEVRSTRLAELNSELSLLTQKQLRLDRAIGGTQGEKKRLDNAVKSIRDDMTRINALIVKNAALRDKLAVATYSTEKAAMDTLKDMERETAGSEARVASIREECARLQEDLVEAERGVLAWEKRIILERETQEALDPSVGEGELQSMEREVSRMRLQADALSREQDKLIGEMERAVEKRDVLAAKHRTAKAMTMAAAAASGKGLISSLGAPLQGMHSAASVGSVGRGKALEGDTVTRVGLEHKAGALREELAMKRQALEEVQGALSSAIVEGQRVATAVANAETQVSALEAGVARLQGPLRTTLFDKQKFSEWGGACERMLARFLALEAGRLPSVGGSPSEVAGVRARLREAEAGASAIGDLCGYLQAQHWDLKDAIQKVRELMLFPTVHKVQSMM